MASRWLNIAESGLSSRGLGASSDAARWRRLARSYRGGLALVALCLAVYLPGLRAIPAVDRDEARFAQASRQMFEAAAFPRIAPERVNPAFHDGGWAVPKIQDRQRLNKPPLIYWLQVASAWTFTGGDPLRDAIWMYRVPSLLAAILTVLITWRLGCSMFDARAAWLAGAILAVAPMIVWDAHQARADSVMMACTTGALAALWRIWQRPTDARFAPLACFWLCLAAGIMTKGFVTPMVVGLAAVCLSATTRRWRWLALTRPALGAIIIAAPLVPWLYFVAQYKGGLAPYAAIVWDEFFVRGVAGSKEGHFWPPGFHTVALAVLFWPGSLMTLAAIGRAWNRARGHAGMLATSPQPGRAARLVHSIRESLARPWHGRPAEMFLLAWIVPAWIVFELSPAKLLHYTMPMLPAVALLSARCVMTTGPDRLGRLIWRSIGIVTLCLALPMAPFESIANSVTSGWLIPALLAANALMAVVLISWPGTALSLVKRALVAWVVGCVLGLGIVAPRLEEPWRTRAYMRVILAVDPHGTRPIALVSYREDSMIFETRGRAERISPDVVAEWLGVHADGLALVDPQRLPSSSRVVGSLPVGSPTVLIENAQ